MKKKLAIAAACLSMAIVLAATFVFAWFSGGDTAYNVRFQIAVVDMRLALYRVNDFDLDGAVDLDENYQAITEAAAIFDTQDAQTDDAIQAVLDAHPVSIPDIMPTQVYTYRLDVYNQGEVDSFLNLDAYTDKSAIPAGFNVSYSAYRLAEDGTVSALAVDVLDAPFDAETGNPDQLVDETEGNYAPVPLVQSGGGAVPSLQLYIQIKFTLDDGMITDGDRVYNPATGEYQEIVFPSEGYGTTFYITISA